MAAGVANFRPHTTLFGLICYDNIPSVFLYRDYVEPIELYCIVLYCIVLYCIVLYCIVLYCIVCGIGIQVHRCLSSKAYRQNTPRRREANRDWTKAITMSQTVL